MILLKIYLKVASNSGIVPDVFGFPDVLGS